MNRTTRKTLAPRGVLQLGKAVCFAFVLCVAAAVSATAQTYTTLVNFNVANGGEPGYNALVQGLDGNLYGTTSLGGNVSCNAPYGCGTVFKMTPAGVLTTLHSFCTEANCADGAGAIDGLLLGTDGNFYGTAGGGAHTNASRCPSGCGIIFKITPAGKLTTLYNFCAQTNCTDGLGPVGGLVQGTDGNLYGTTAEGGTGPCTIGCGTVFKITPSGVLSTLHSFNITDGWYPYAALIQATDGSFYGTTFEGGGNQDCDDQGYPSCGTVFKITPAGVLTTLHSFVFTDGANPWAPLLQEADGTFSGTTSLGGIVTSEGCTQGCGTVFKIKSNGAFTTLHTFVGSFAGGPVGGLIQATDGAFYGAAGIIFMPLPYTVFENTPASSTLVQATSGIFYGTTYGGGFDVDDGTAFSFDLGLGPFVTTLPTVRKVGQHVTILGSGLTGATSVSFNGRPAVFSVVSATEITTTVPRGATTGPVTVATPVGALTSNISFRVTK